MDPAENMRQDLAGKLADLEHYRMPFGRFRGILLHRLPYEYLHWFEERGGGFPKGRLGELMSFVHQIKSTGAEEIFARLPKD